jgi:SET domain-containing protein
VVAHETISSTMGLELNPRLEIRPSRIEGLGIFALEAFDEGERFLVVLGDAPTVFMSDVEFEKYRQTVDSFDAVYLGDGIHRVSLVPRNQNPSNFGNHSCDPNTRLDGEHRKALRRIEVGDELTVDYAEFSPKGWSMVCNCGSATCSGTVRGRVS